MGAYRIKDICHDPRQTDFGWMQLGEVAQTLAGMARSEIDGVVGNLAGAATRREMVKRTEPAGSASLEKTPKWAVRAGQQAGAKLCGADGAN